MDNPFFDLSLSSYICSLIISFHDVGVSFSLSLFLSLKGDIPSGSRYSNRSLSYYFYVYTANVRYGQP